MSRVAVYFTWNGVSLDQYDQVQKAVEWEENVPEGVVLHVSSHDGQALRITDVWESAEDFNTFVNERLMQVTKEIGLTGEPHVEILPLHFLYNSIDGIDEDGMEEFEEEEEEIEA
jgi:hypothetical protein